MTHLSSADCSPRSPTHRGDADDDATTEQLRRFDAARAKVIAAGHAPGTLHVANTAATLRRADARFDLVRPGGALYGVRPTPSDGAELRPALRLRTEVIALRDLPAGECVGYDRTFRTARPTRIATVPVGYGDGLLRELSGRGEMLVRGARCPIAGRVSMDLTTLDVTDVPGVAVGDEVVALGSQKHEGREATLRAEDVAAKAGTIAYDVLTSISRRVPRTYL
jgi:alanine racemase